MINSAYEWVEIFFFALAIGLICTWLVIMALIMAFVYLIKAIFTLDFKWIVE